VDLQEANLLGLGDTLSVGYANTDGSNTINANYTLPINAHNGTVFFAVSLSVLDIQSNTIFLNLTPMARCPPHLSTCRTEYLSCILTTGTFILFDNNFPS